MSSFDYCSLGVVPYPGVSGSDLLGYLQRGYRLPKPSETAPEMLVDPCFNSAGKPPWKTTYEVSRYRYEIMETCWETSPSARPLFKDLESKLESYLQKHSVRSQFNLLGQGDGN